MERLRGSLDAMGEAHEPVRSTVQGVGFRLREEGTEFPFLEGVEAPPGHLWTGGGQGEPLRQGVPRSRVAATPVPGKRAQTARPALPGMSFGLEITVMVCRLSVVRDCGGWSSRAQ